VINNFIKNIEYLKILEATSTEYYFSHILCLCNDFLLDQFYDLLQAIRLNVHRIILFLSEAICDNKALKISN